MGRKVIDGLWDRDNLNSINDNFYELFLGKGGQISLIRNLVGSTKSITLAPPAGESIKGYAERIGDKYFNGLMSLKTTPGNSMNPDYSFDIESGGYFFYTLNAVEQLAPGKPMSLLVYTEKKNENFTVEYAFYDEIGKQLQIIPVPQTSPNVYLEEGILIPANTAKITIRLDNRNGTSTVNVSKLLFVADERFGLFNFEATGLQSQITATNKSITDLKTKLAERGMVIMYPQPKDFGLTSHMLKGRVYTDGKGTFGTDFNVESLKNPNGKTYYVSGSGSNSNDGLSASSPLADMYTAMSKSDVNTVMVDGNYSYYRTATGYMLGAVKNNINIIGYNGRPKIMCSEVLKFAITDGYTNVYQASRSAVARVININDIDDKGDYREFKKVNSIQEVDSTPNSWYTASNVVYVNQNNSTVNDADIRCLLTSDLLRIAGDFNVYLENIELIGGNRNIRYETSTGTLVLNKCKLSYSVQSNGNGIEMVGGKYCVSKETEISKQMMDGFNYHKGANGELPYFIEIDCIGRDNGFEQGTAGSKSNNGSTSHDGIKGIRINGIYARNDGGNVADVNAGTQSWNLGAVAFESFQTSDFQTTTGAIQFLDDCRGYGSKYSIYSGNAEDKVYIRNGSFATKSIAGTEKQY